jgi:quercetin dioxygenase-like cupin family protein
MTEKVKQIAMRIKGLREISGATAEQIARELKVPKAEYEKYENGTADIPVSFLYEVAQKFDVELTALLTGEEPRLKTYALVRGAKALSVERRKEYKYKDLAYNFIGKKAEIFMVTAEPGKGKKPHAYSHPGQEFNYIIKGSLKVTIDGNEVELDEGDSLYFNSGKAHRMEAMHGKPAKFLAVIL